ncbi:hypothetical protein ACFFQF_00975 [Haladaptatus pallidirubidus]|uniref:Right handed beta helix region n=1 Tax=Haladaptatus pallidirubidus TaxID=1008152 RepID=A0AAV3UBU0_9EURY|nr:hypothetical protein [Haladaptatus pallidirubidus]
MPINNPNALFETDDPLNEETVGKLVKLFAKADSSGFIFEGLSTTADHANNDISVGSGRAIIVNGEQAYPVEHPGVTDASMATSSGVNVVRVVYNPSVNDDVTIDIRTKSASAPTNPALKIAEVDSLNDQPANEFNRQKDDSFGTVQILDAFIDPAGNTYTGSVPSWLNGTTISPNTVIAGQTFTDPAGNSYTGGVPSWLDGSTISPDGVNALESITTPSLNGTIKYVTAESQLQNHVGNGNTVIIPSGTTISVTDPVILGDNDHLQIEPGATIRQADGSNLSNFRTVVRTHGDNIIVDGGGTIDVNAAGQSAVGYRGVGDVQGSGPYKNIRVKDLTIYNAGERSPVEFGRSSNVWVKDCTFGGGSQFDTSAVAIEARSGDITNINVVRNTVRPLHSTLSGDTFFVDSITDSGHKVRRFSINDNTIEGPFGTRTTNESGGWQAILVEEGGQSGTISENKIRASPDDGSGAGIHVNSITGAGGTGTITITGNTVKGDPNATQPDGSSVNGILISPDVLCSVTGNICVGFSNNNIANNSNESVIVGNMVNGSIYDNNSDAVIANNR